MGGKILGPTDPADAPEDSLRGLINAKWKELGLSECPNVGDNGVHASASPFEALAERMNWLGAECASDPFGAALLNNGVELQTIKEFSVDPQVMGMSLFDQCEDQDYKDCVNTLLQLRPGGCSDSDLLR